MMEIESLEVRCSCCGEKVGQAAKLWADGSNIVIMIVSNDPEMPPLILTVRMKETTLPESSVAAVKEP